MAASVSYVTMSKWTVDWVAVDLLTADTVLGVGMENTHACLQRAAAGELGRSGAQVLTSFKKDQHFQIRGCDIR